MSPWRNAVLAGGLLRQSVRNTFGVPSLCNLEFKLYVIIFSHWRCAPPILCNFMSIFSFRGMFSPFKMLRWCLVCVICTCNSNSFHSFIIKLCIMIAHTLKMCTSSRALPILCTTGIFWGMLNTSLPPFGCLHCVICVKSASQSFHSFIFKLCIMIIHTLKMYTSYFVLIW